MLILFLLFLICSSNYISWHSRLRNSPFNAKVSGFIIWLGILRSKSLWKIKYLILWSTALATALSILWAGWQKHYGAWDLWNGAVLNLALFYAKKGTDIFLTEQYYSEHPIMVLGWNWTCMLFQTVYVMILQRNINHNIWKYSELSRLQTCSKNSFRILIASSLTKKKLKTF